ncbi:MAG: tyrosine-type recombinase/integrase [Brevinema sp.]
MDLNSAYTLYIFRYTFATNLLNKTNDIHLVSKALGHSNIIITSKHYANRSSKDIQERISAT